MRVHLYLVSSIIFICMFPLPLYGKAEQPGATEIIKTFNSALLDSMKRAEELGFSGRYRLLEPVIKNSFDLSFMARKSVGKYWKTLNEEQKRLLLETFTNWSIATYAGRFDGYSGERFKVLDETVSGRRTIAIISHLIKSNGEIVEFNFRLRKIKGTWRIVDIQIEGVSQLALTRSQFLSVIRRKGFDALISTMEEKVESYSKGS